MKPKQTYRLRSTLASVAFPLLVGSTVGCSPEPESVASLAARGTSREIFADAPTARRAAEMPQGQGRQPRAFVAAAVHDFGTMVAHEVKRHTFVVCNQGDAPLTIEQGVSSCTCTMSRSPSEPIQPGGQGEIELEWTAQPSAEPFDQTVEFVTNDPIKRLLKLRVVGRVLGEIYVDPPYFDAERSRPDEPRELEVTISSPVWDQFEVLDATPSLDGVECEFAPFDVATIDNTEAKSAWRLRAALPKDLPSGRFRHSVAVRIQPPGAVEEPRCIEIPLVGSVLRRVAVYGKGIDSEGVVRFGVVEPLEEHRLRFLVKVRDQQPELRIAQQQVVPEFLNINLQPVSPEHGGDNLYQLDVTIPADAPPSVHQGDSRGKIRIVFEHPRIEPLDLGVDFAVRPRGRTRIANAAR